MKTESKVKSIFDPSIQRSLLVKARLASSTCCEHPRSEEADIKAQMSRSPIKSFELMAFRCSLCKVGFSDLQEQRSHFKSDWHVFNVRQKVKFKESIAESVFISMCNKEEDISKGFVENCSMNEDETDDESEEDMKNEIGSPKVMFLTDIGHYFSIYRALLEKEAKGKCSSCCLLDTAIKSLGNDNSWIILMMSGGHFAAAVFQKQELIAHKTIHRYVVRAKRGTVQSQRDGKQSGKPPRSAGAHIRRQNEIALVSEIRALLQKWTEHVDHADRIFLSWPQRAKTILFDGKEPMLRKSDPRVTKVPFVTGKPTLDELKRTHQLLSTFTLSDSPDDSS